MTTREPFAQRAIEWLLMASLVGFAAFIGWCIVGLFL
jgi:hypothetical protein